MSTPGHLAAGIRVAELTPSFSTESPSADFAFGASTLGSLTLVHVRARVEDARGRSAAGWGAIFLSHPWAFPGPRPAPEVKDAIMRDLVTACAARTGATGHPLDHYLAFAEEMEAITAGVAGAHGLTVPIPPLCTLVAYSSIDAALHDAYGNLHGINAYDALGAEHLGWDLSRVFGPAWRGRYPGEFLRKTPAERVPISHTVGATDPLREDQRTASSIPPLPWWIGRDGVFSFKVKLKGQDLEWDIQRLVDVYMTARDAHRGAGAGARDEVRVFGDLNEGAPSTAYIGELVDALERRSPDAFAALEALEQPFPRRDLADISVAGVSRRVPIALDEGLTSLATLEEAIANGWNAVALKTCKTQSLMALTIPRAIEAGMAISVQDLTNPGIALLQSAGLAARLPRIVPFESNQRQYFPATSAPEAAVHPDIFRVRDGHVPTGPLTGPGFGYGIERIAREIFVIR